MQIQINKEMDLRLTRAWKMAFVACLMFALAVRILIIANVEILGHDDSISIMAAAGHHLDFDSGPSGQLVLCGEWQALLQPDTFLPLTRIAEGLAQADTHPPLYFWLLHLGLYFTGDTLHIGGVLNIILELCILLFLYRLARQIMPQHWQAYAVCSVWVLSPTTLDAVLATRQYTLFALFTVMLADVTYRWFYKVPDTFVSRRQWVRYITVLGLCTAGGMLTHYYFTLVLLTGFVAIVIRNMFIIRDTRWRAYLTGLVAGAIVFSLAFWQIFAHFNRVFSRYTPNFDDSLSVLQRLSTYFGLLFQLYLDDNNPVVRVLYMALILIAGYFTIRNRRRIRLRYTVENIRHHPRLLYLLTFIIGLFGLHGILYLSPNTPNWALGGRYAQPLWLFMAFVPVVLFSQLHRRVHQYMTGFIVVMVLSLASVTLPGKYNQFQVTVPPLTTPILINTQARGVLLPLVQYLPQDSSIFVQWGDALINNRSAWARMLVDSTGTYLETKRYRAAEDSSTLRALFTEMDLHLTPLDLQWRGSDVDGYHISAGE